MLINNIKEFASHIPLVGGFNPNEDVTTFDAFKPFLEDGEYWLESQLLGKDLFDKIESDARLKELASIVVACTGYYSGIPFNDLVQTPTGFGVVSNSNTAPASSERVNRLLTWIDERRSEAIDNLIIYVFCDKNLNTLWSKFGLYEYYTECIFMTASTLRRYGKKDALRNDLEEGHAMLMNFQMDIARVISEEYMSHLIEARRAGALSPEDTSMIRSVMCVMGLKYKGEPCDVYPMMETMVNSMVANIEKYPAYKSSKAYALKKSNNYSNQKGDPTFFFT